MSEQTPQPEGWRVEYYRKLDGTVPVQDFIEELEGKHLRDAVALIQLLGMFGNTLRKKSKMVEMGLFELKGHQVRIFYIFRPGKRIILLDGIIKKQDEIPSEVLKRVRGYRREFESRDKGA